MNIFVMEQSRWRLLKNKNILINMRKKMSRESFIEAETNKFLTRFLFPHRTNTLERKIMFGIYLIQFTNIKLQSICLTTFFVLFYHARKYCSYKYLKLIVAPEILTPSMNFQKDYNTLVQYSQITPLNFVVRQNHF